MNPQLLGIASEMERAGLPERFIDAAVELANLSQKAKALMQYWHTANQFDRPFDRAAAREALQCMIDGAP